MKHLFDVSSQTIKKKKKGTKKKIQFWYLTDDNAENDDVNVSISVCV